MTAASIKWIIVSVLAIGLGGWLLHLSLRYAALAQTHTDVSKVKDSQIRTISQWNELDQSVRTARDREGGEHWSLKYALASFREKKISRDLFESFVMPCDNYALYSHSDTTSGFLLLPGEESEVVAYMRTLTPGETKKRPVEYLKQTLEFPDRRIILPVKPNHLTEYEFDTTGAAGALEFGFRVTDIEESRFVPICDVNDRHEFAASDGPYQDGIFKDHEHEVTYGWPQLSDLSFLKTLHKNRIWMIACNEVFRPVDRPADQSNTLHVALVFASKREWRIHPDYLYSRSLNSGFDLEWDPQQEDYLATPRASK
jgi:hypothetical protein